MALQEPPGAAAPSQGRHRRRFLARPALLARPARPALGVVALATVLGACEAPQPSPYDPPAPHDPAAVGSTSTAVPPRAARHQVGDGTGALAAGRHHGSWARTSPTVLPPTTAPPTTLPPTTAPPATTEPGGGSRLFPGHRVVAFYGEAGNPALGVLGSSPPEQLWPTLLAQADAYQQAGAPVIPAYELIAYVARGSPGPDGTYAARIASGVISHYLHVVRAHHGLLILDIQPGRGQFLADAQALAPFLSQPDVALAMDPEWKLEAGQVPDSQIGHTTAAVINQVSAWLAQLAADAHLPQKLLLIHQFTPSMVEDGQDIQQRADVAIALNMDGFGGQAAKISEYRSLAAPGTPAGSGELYLGFKLFYHQDVGLMSPAQVLALAPPPDIVEYE